MKISRGKKQTAVRTVIYGVEGIGKSTLVSHWPDPIYIDTENGTLQLDVNRVDGIKTWNDVINAVKEVIADPSICKTLVIDTADKAEEMLISEILQANKKTSIEDFGYGKGYTMVQEQFQKELLNNLDKLIALGINVVVVAHAIVRTITPPDEDPYDHWELKCSRKVSPILKEWADMLLFCNYRITVVEGPNGKGKATGSGKRMMYANHKPTYDAKNRFGLPDEMPLDYSLIAHVIDGTLEAQPTAKLDMNSEATGIIDADNPVEEYNWKILVREAKEKGITENQMLDYLGRSGYGSDWTNYSDSLIDNLREHMDSLAANIKGEK